MNGIARQRKILFVFTRCQDRLLYVLDVFLPQFGISSQLVGFVF